MKKIIHLSDLHIGRSDLYERFKYVCKSIHKLAEPPGDFVILITGDLVQNSSDDKYGLAKKWVNKLRSYGFTVLAIPGNHDYAKGLTHRKECVEKFSHHFHNFDHTITATGIDELYPKVDIIESDKESMAFIGLDSMVAELDPKTNVWPNGQLGEPQLDRLEKRLRLPKVVNSQYKIVYLHHHPWKVGFSNPYGAFADLINADHLKDDDKLEKVICDYMEENTLKHKIDAILFGHKHFGFVWEDRWGIPRCYDAGSSTEKAIKIIGQRPEHRVIDLSADPSADYDGKFLDGYVKGDEETEKNDRVYEYFSGLLDKQRNGVLQLPFNYDEKYVVFSDIHMGDKSGADDFKHNKHVFMKAMKHYDENGFKFILLGDIYETWQFDYPEIEDQYGDTLFSYFEKLFDDNRLYFVFGNHDGRWGNGRETVGTDEYDHLKNACEAIRLGEDIILTHGHQYDPGSQKSAWIKKIGLHAFRLIEPGARLLGYRHMSATKSQIAKEKERFYYKWASENKKLLICGHTHNAMFASLTYSDWLEEQIEDLHIQRLKLVGKLHENRKKLVKTGKELIKLKRKLEDEIKKNRNIEPLESEETDSILPCYFNSGCCLYTNGITAIEIDNETINLVKWDRKSNKEGPTSVFWSEKEHNLKTLLKEISNG